MKHFTVEKAAILLLLGVSSEASRAHGGISRGGDSVARAGNRIKTSYRISNLSTGPDSSFNFGVNAGQQGGKAVSQDTPLTARDIADYLLELEARADDDLSIDFSESNGLLAREANRIVIGQFGGNARSGPAAPNFSNGRAGGNAAGLSLQRRFMDGGKGGDARGGNSKARAGNKAYKSTKIENFTANGAGNTFDFSSSSVQSGGNAQSGPGGANYGNGGQGGKGGDLSLSLSIPAKRRRDISHDMLETRDISDDELSLYLYARHLELELESLEARDLEEEESDF